MHSDTQKADKITQNALGQHVDSTWVLNSTRALSPLCVRQLYYTHCQFHQEHSRIVRPICTPKFSCESIPQMGRGVFTSAHQAGMQETYGIMFTSGMWNNSSGERFEVLTEALVKTQSSGMRCCVIGQVVHSVSRIVVSSSSGSSSPQRIIISRLYCISSSSSIHSTFLPSLPTSQQLSTDTACTIPSDLPPSAASHYPHHQYLQHIGCLFTLACLTQKKNALWSLEVWSSMPIDKASHQNTLIFCVHNI